MMPFAEHVACVSLAAGIHRRQRLVSPDPRLWWQHRAGCGHGSIAGGFGQAQAGDQHTGVAHAREQLHRRDLQQTQHAAEQAADDRAEAVHGHHGTDHALIDMQRGYQIYGEE
ncbi:hypothetical protein BW07_10970 [Bifidobacterium sp. UTCIF-36]|nr:hypothetical protein BW07_10970 [Bifidobacterium sp. UTCIF-36]